jgi:hypothetical protein
MWIKLGMQFVVFPTAIQKKYLTIFQPIFVIGFWVFSGTHKTKFIPGLVGSFLEMTLIPEEGEISLFNELSWALH